MTFLDSIGIHPVDLESAFEQCSEIFKKVDLDADDDLCEMLDDSFEEILNPKFRTNSIIREMFECTTAILREQYPNIKLVYYVNGLDSHIQLVDW